MRSQRHHRSGASRSVLRGQGPPDWEEAAAVLLAPSAFPSSPPLSTLHRWMNKQSHLHALTPPPPPNKQNKNSENWYCPLNPPDPRVGDTILQDRRQSLQTHIEYAPKTGCPCSYVPAPGKRTAYTLMDRIGPQMCRQLPMCNH